MDLGLIKSFLVLSNSYSYSKAAEKLCITQSALTKQINKLEDNLNLILFERGRNGVHLTQTGRFLLPFAEELLAKNKKFKQIAKNTREGINGYLNIGFGLSAFQLAPSMVFRFKQHYNEIEVTLNDIPSAAQIALLENGDLALGFLRLPVSTKLRQYPLLQDELTLVVNQSVDTELSISQILENNPFLSLTENRGPGLNFQIAQFLKANQLNVNHINYSDDIQTLLALIASGLGVSILPKSAVLLGVQGIKSIPLSGDFSRWQVGLVWNAKIENKIRDHFLALFDIDRD